MTQTSYFLTNGSSLEDCHTNFFALADLCGIKWRQYSCEKNFNDLSDDPILNSYAKCINANLLCVWRRVRNVNNNTQEPTTNHRDLHHHHHHHHHHHTQISYSKELWIFWYGDEPDLKELLSGNLKEGDQGSWESGLSYECRALLFKALHNLIERCLLSKGYSRIGRWFFQPKPRDSSGDILKEGTQITFTFNFFLHGDSNVCANVDVRQHSTVRPITKEDIWAAQQLPDGIRVILSPYGLQGYLTGCVFKDNDQNVQKFLSDWNKIYPLASYKAPPVGTFGAATMANTIGEDPSSATSGTNNDFTGKVVEVMVGNYRLKYPVSYVYITETDSKLLTIKLSCQNDKVPRNLMETAAQLERETEERLENVKLAMSTYENPTPSDTFQFKNNFNQVMNFCDRTHHSATTDKSADLLNKSDNCVEIGGRTSSSLLKKPCNCHKCQNPSHRRHSKSGAGFIKSKNLDKEKSKHGKGTNPFHHRMPMELMHEINFYLFCSYSTMDSPLMNGVNGGGNGSTTCINNSGPGTNNSNQNGTSQTGITPMMMPYKSPVSTSTSSILNTPGVEASPMSNFNMESHEHISPKDQEMMNLMSSTPNPQNNHAGNNNAQNNQQQQVGSSPRPSTGAAAAGDKSNFDSSSSSLMANSAVNNLCDPSMKLMRSTENSNENAVASNSDQQQPQTIIDALIPKPMDRKFLKRAQRYRSIYDDESTFRLRNGLLYDFSTELEWEVQYTKYRRFSKHFLDRRDDMMNNGGHEHRDPYEFSEFGEDHGLRSIAYEQLDPAAVELNPSQLNGLYGESNGQKLAEMNNGNGGSILPMNQMNHHNDVGNGNAVLAPHGKNGPENDVQFLHSPADEANATGTTLVTTTTTMNEAEAAGAVISSLNNSNVLSAAELLRMYPTPPSLEAMVASPCSTYTAVGTENKTSAETKPELIESDKPAAETVAVTVALLPCGSDPNPKESSASPLVYMPPKQSVFITSNKYAPLENVECKNTLPAKFHYKHNVRTMSPMKGSFMPPQLSVNNHFGPPFNPNPYFNKSKYPIPPMANHRLASSSSFPNSMIRTGTRVNCQPPNMMSGAAMMSPHHHMQQHRMRNQANLPPRLPLDSCNNFRPNAMDAGFSTSPMVVDNRRSPYMFPQHHHQPLNSPSSNHPNSMVMMGPGNGPPPHMAMKMMGPNAHHPGLYGNPAPAGVDSPASTANIMPNESNSLMLNMLLSDSMFNLFRDHNFESCSICVCNMNIKGNDVGIYLPDTSQPGQAASSSNNYDYYNTCSCGFSAITNRHLSLSSGLFYEDEVEVTGIFYEPVADIGHEASGNGLLELPENYFDDTFKKALRIDLDENFMKLIMNQSTTIFPSTSTLARIMYCDRNQAFKMFDLADRSPTMRRNPLRLLYDDYSAVVGASLQMARCEVSGAGSGGGGPKQSMMMMPAMFSHHQMSTMSAGPTRPLIHEWQFKRCNYPVNNHEMMLNLRHLQPLLQESVQRRDGNAVTYNTVKGPLTWRQFHRLAGRGTECQCEPQPIPSLLVGYDKECVALSPFGLKFWEKLSLEPYAITRDIYYVVVAPPNTENHHENHFIPSIRNFFKDFSTIYEILRLGRHSPLAKVSPDGIYSIDSSENKPGQFFAAAADEWFGQLGDSNLASKIRFYGQALFELLPYLSVTDRGCFEARANNTANNNSNEVGSVCNNSVMNNTSMNGNVSGSYGSAANQSSSILSSSYSVGQKSLNNFNASTSDHHQQQQNNQTQYLNDIDPSSHATGAAPSGSGTHDHHSHTTNVSFQPYDEDEGDPHKYPSIVIYVLESFSSLGKEVTKLASIALMKTFSMLKKYLPEPMRENVHLQMLSLNSVVCNDKDFRDHHRQAQLKELSFAVYSQCRQQLVMQSNIKSLTGLGPAASFELFLKNKNSIFNRVQLHTTPYILAPLKDKQTELGEMFGERREKCQILYCSYCLTEDKRWLIASCTNDKGDILHTKIININIPNRTRRRNAKVRRFGLDKLMQFIHTVMSESVLPWRLIIGRLGRIGHGELKDWTFLLSKRSLLKYSRQLRDTCDQCRYIGNAAEQPAIYSACLISIEADTSLRVFPNYYTPDERFSSSCNTCSLSTPEDATCTHILVFPTSATTQSAHGNFNFLSEELFTNLDDHIPVDEMEEIDLDLSFFPDDGLLDEPPRRDGPGQPDSPGNRQMFGNSASLKNSGLDADQDEPAQLSQQPLALAFYVSTARTGPLPRWFWSHCPHLENSCPVFLKSALLIHTPSVQQNPDDILHSNNRDCHPLDSNLTTDVLRYSLEGYNALSWLVLDPVTNDRLSCLPLHIQVLMQLYHTVQALVQ